MRQPSLLPDSGTHASETPLLRDVMVQITALDGSMFFRNQVGLFRTIDGRYVRIGVNGAADIIGCYRGRGVAIETKHPKTGRLQADQRNFGEVWRKAGGLYLPCRHVDEALQALSRL